MNKILKKKQGNTVWELGKCSTSFSCDTCGVQWRSPFRNCPQSHPGPVLSFSSGTEDTDRFPRVVRPGRGSLERLRSPVGALDPALGSQEGLLRTGDTVVTWGTRCYLSEQEAAADSPAMLLSLPESWSWIFKTPSGDRCFCDPHFPDEETEAWTG